jgi:hypothetical protein
MNKREMADLRELLERIDRLLKEYLMTSSPDQLAVLEAEITAAKEKLKQIAASLVN